MEGPQAQRKQILLDELIWIRSRIGADIESLPGVSNIGFGVGDGSFFIRVGMRERNMATEGRIHELLEGVPHRIMGQNQTGWGQEASVDLKRSRR
jgi:hypothetical protein